MMDKKNIGANVKKTISEKPKFAQKIIPREYIAHIWGKRGAATYVYVQLYTRPNPKMNKKNSNSCGCNQFSLNSAHTTHTHSLFLNSFPILCNFYNRAILCALYANLNVCLRNVFSRTVLLKLLISFFDYLF